MRPRFLLDTHILIRWLLEPKKLSKEQLRVMRNAVRQGEPLAVSAVTLLEIAVLFGEARTRLRVPAESLLDTIQPAAGFRVLPIDVAVATEVAALGDSLRDPADRAIIATTLVHRLTLLTSDSRIVESRLVPVVE